MVTPSVAVAAIESLFPFSAQPAAGGYVAALAELRSAIETWQQRGATVTVDFEVFKTIRAVLQKCPDRVATGPDVVFAFLKDPPFQSDLAMDVAEVDAAIANGEWKSATVLAGSVIEALLLWAHQQDTSRAVSAAAAARETNKLTQQVPKDLLAWTLHHHIEVAGAAELLTERTTTLARLTKDYRNLIHPGRAQRLSEKPDRSTALTATAGMYAVIRELKAILA